MSASMQKLNPLVALAQTAFDWRSRPLTADVERAARRALLDWFATTLPGTVQPPSTLLSVATAGEISPGGAICYVDGRRSAPRRAALINAVASHTVEFDDIFKDGGYHPGSPTIAAALAVAQHIDAPLDGFHRAVIAGYEVGCRISLAIQPSHYAFWHITSTIGTIGAAVAAAHLMGCDARGIGHAIALASSFTGGHQENLRGEGMAKAMHPGHAADAGVLAAQAAHAGITGSLESLHGAVGYAAATSASTGNWDAALSGLGDWTPITRMTVKAHGCCGHIFPSLDGLAVLRQREGFELDDIEFIKVRGYAATKSMCDRPEIASAQDARFSLQYCLGAQMLLGGVRLSAFEPQTLSDPRLRRFMARVQVEEDAEIAAAYPGKRMAKIEVGLKDGRQVSHFQTVRRGDPESPLSDDELIAKFDELAAEVLPAGSAAALKQVILEGASLPRDLVFLREIERP